MEKQRRPRGRPLTFDRVAALNIATRLFWQHGYDGTSIAMLTEQMGISPPTLYGAFGSKEDLYSLALAHYEQQDDLGRSAAGGASAPYLAIERFLRGAALSFTRPDMPKGCMIMTGGLQTAAGNERLMEVAGNARRARLKAFREQLEHAKRGEMLPGNVDCDAVARFYTSVIEGMSVQAIDGANAQQLNALVDVALAAWPRNQ